MGPGSSQLYNCVEKCFQSSWLNDIWLGLEGGVRDARGMHIKKDIVVSIFN